MSDSNVTPASEAGTSPSIISQLRDKVKAAVKEACQQGHEDSPLERTVRALREETLENRTKIFRSALEKYTSLEADFRKLKPDSVTYIEDAEGNEVEQKAYSKERRESRKKLKEKMSKLDKLITAAATDPNPDTYKKLSEFKG